MTQDDAILKGLQTSGVCSPLLFLWKYRVAHVQFASKYRNCTCPSSFRFAAMYNYTRKIRHFDDPAVYLFTPKTSALRYGYPDLRNRLVTKPKSLKHMYNFDRLVDFVHESKRFPRGFRWMYIYSCGDLPVCYEFLVPRYVDFRYIVDITRLHIIVVFSAAVMHRFHIFVIYQSYGFL